MSSTGFAPVRFGIEVVAGSNSAKLRVVWTLVSSPGGPAGVQAVAATVTSP